MKKRQVQTYTEEYVQEILSADRYANDNVDTPNGMNREEGDQKKNKINSTNT